MRTWVMRGRQGGKHTESVRPLGDAISRGEHVHWAAVGVQKCWNGTSGCRVWHAQRERGPDQLPIK